MRTIVYIDGFNLYYRMQRNRPDLKWVNPLRMAKAALDRSHDILSVNYYIARIAQRASDPHAPARQDALLKALSSVPAINIHEGSFMKSEPWMELAEPPQAKPSGYAWTEPPPKLVKVVKTEEKGSDVNLGVHLVRDAFTNAFDVAVVVTNDSDLIEPIRIVKEETGKRVGLLAPVKFPNNGLKAAASFYRHLRPGHLLAARFPETLSLPDGRSVTRPASWT
jgi:uncharacterized LabA/DUF88 family protein